MKTLKLMLAVMLLSCACFAQANWYGSVAQGMAYVNGIRVEQPLPGAEVLVCTYGSTCDAGHAATIYSDSTATEFSVNPFPADNQGNFGFWALPGNYQYTFTYKGNSYGPFTATVGILSVDGLDISPKSISSVQYVQNGNVQAAHDALGANGGVVRIPAGSYTIPLGSIVVTKPGTRFICDSPNSTILTFTGVSGKAFSFEYTTDPYGNVSQWGASIENCKLIGPGGIDGSGNAGTAVSLGTATLAPTGVRIINSVIAGFSKGIIWGTGSAAYLEVAHSVFANNTQDLVYDAAVNAGTNATFDDVKFLNWSAPMVANKLVFSSAVGGKFVFKNCGFNNSQVVVSSPAMWIFFDNPTFENDEGNTTLNYYTQSVGTVVMKSPQFFQHFSTGLIPDAFVAVSGGAISIDDWNGTTAQTMTSAFKFSGNANWHVGRQVTGAFSGSPTGFTDDVASTSAGYSTYVDHRGSVQLFPAQNGEVQPMLQVGRKNSYNLGEVDLPADLRLTGFSAGTPTAFISAADTSGTHDLDLTFRVQNAGTVAEALKLVHVAGNNTVTQVQDVLRFGASGPSVLNGSASTRNAVRTAYPSVALGSIYLSTAGKMYLKVANAGADTDWQLVTSTAAD